MPLYLVQDSDGATYVLARNYQQAIEKWQRALAIENDGEVFEPNGVAMVAEDSEVVFHGDFAEKPDWPGEMTENEVINRLAKTAYDAYCAWTGWKSVISGAALPPFDKTHEAVQNGWKAAAKAVFHHLT